MEWVIALNRGDSDRAFGELMTPGAHRREPVAHGFSGSLGQRSRHELRRPEAMVVSTRTWPSALCSLSPNWFVVRLEREAVGRDGETYAWTWLTVSAVRDGRFESSCVFDVEDEDAAFAYAEERMRATASRLAVTNRASDRLQRRTATRCEPTMSMAPLDCCSDQLVYDDHRRVSGDPVDGLTELRAAYRAPLRAVHAISKRARWPFEVSICT